MKKNILIMGASALTALLLSACGDNGSTRFDVGPGTFSQVVKNEICLGTSETAEPILVEDISIADNRELVAVENLCG